MKAMVSCLARRMELIRSLGGTLTGDDEQNEHLEVLQSEQEVLTPLVDTVGYTIKFFRNQAFATFESNVAPILGPY